MRFATFARLDGLAVVIVSYGDMFTVVRYCGHKGKAIRTCDFVVETSFLTEF